MIEKKDWIKYFPHKTVRPGQETAINFIIQSFKNGYKYVIGEFAPGIGKSAIAITVCNYLYRCMDDAAKTSYIVTTQKILQEQYMRDFPYLANVMSKKNYQCINRIAGITCDMGLTMAKILSKNPGSYVKYADTCIYKQNKNNFDSSPISLTNLSYFLSHVDSDLKYRDLLIIDECHNIENIVTDFAELSFTKYFVQDVLKLPFPYSPKLTIDSFVSWIKNVYSAKLSDSYLGLEGKITSMKSQSYLESNSGIAAMKKLEDYKRKIEQISVGFKHFNRNEWVMSVSPAQDIISIKPIFADKYTNNMLFRMADKILMMSGTILDKDTYCRNIGIDPKDAVFMALDSPFPVKNRPVFEVPVGSMSMKSIDKTLPLVISTIKELLTHHPKEKGIIHCHTYKIAKYIADNINDDRLVFHSADDRTDAVNFHIKSKEPTVLVSPSLTEGIDLIGELSRFQIIVKVPFPYLGDNYVKEKMERVGGWYNWQTLKSVIQASGRSIRDYNDYAITYILDSDWLFLKKRNMNMIPTWFKNAIQDK